jgi:hypothetical protein
MHKPKQHKPLNDLSRSLTPLNVNHTLIAVIDKRIVILRTFLRN